MYVSISWENKLSLLFTYFQIICFLSVFRCHSPFIFCNHFFFYLRILSVLSVLWRDLTKVISKTDMSRPWFESTTSCTGGKHSSKEPLQVCKWCRSGIMRIRNVYPGSRFLSIPGSNNSIKRGGKLFCPYMFCSHKYRKIVNFIFEQVKNFFC